MGHLYFGDNLDVLASEHVPPDTVDLIYLDPPFNSQVQYNAIFKTPAGQSVASQAEAFDDTWTWGPEAQHAYDRVISTGSNASRVLVALRESLGTSDMMAYLAMMAARLSAMHRVLRPTGSLYLHCDPTAAHYLKVILDGVFGPRGFKNEISWRRQSAHNDVKQGRRQYGNVRDTILFYAKGETWTWNPLYTEYDEKYIEDFYRHYDDDGRRYRLSDMTGPGGAAKGNPVYEVMGVTRAWRYSEARMGALIEAGRVYQSSEGRVPQEKRYLDEMPGVALQNDWNDIRPIGRGERLGYPTQKPLALLERIISVSSSPGDVVLDPFCGCGTAVHAAQALGREWIGIDITHYAVSVIEDRLRKHFPNTTPEIDGRPRTAEEAAMLAARSPYQFQWWAAWRLGAQVYRQKKGGDGGVDGMLYFRKPLGATGKVIISVKSGRSLNPDMVRSLALVVQHEGADLGVMLTLHPPTSGMISTALAEGQVRITRDEAYPKIQIVAVPELLRDDWRLPAPIRSDDRTPMPSRSNRRQDDRQLALPLSFQGGKQKSKDKIYIDPRFSAAIGDS